MLVAGMIILVIDTFIFWWTSPDLAWQYATPLVWAFGTDIPWPSQQRRIIELVPQIRGIALAVTATLVFCGIGFGSATANLIAVVCIQHSPVIRYAFEEQFPRQSAPCPHRSGAPSPKSSPPAVTRGT